MSNLKNNFKKEAFFVTFLMISMAVMLPLTQAISLPKNIKEEIEINENKITSLRSINEGRSFSLVIHSIAEVDEIDDGTRANWILRMYVNGIRKDLEADGDTVTINKMITWENIPSDQTILEVKLELQEEDLWFDDIADISAHDGEGADNKDDFDDYRGAVFIRNFDLGTDSWVPQDENNDYVEDTSDGKWYITSGTFDKGSGDGNDATIYFNVLHENSPPYKPEKPSGPEEGNINTLYTYTVSSSGDPDGDEIKFGWDWDGDREVEEWTSESSSNSCKIQHKWSEPGKYVIRVMAKDEKGMESELSEPLVVIIGSPSCTVIEETWYGFSYTIYLSHADTQALISALNKLDGVIAAVASLLKLVGIDPESADLIARAMVKLSVYWIRFLDKGDGVYFRVAVVIIEGKAPVAIITYMGSR